MTKGTRPGSFGVGSRCRTLVAALLAMLVSVGCARGPALIPADARQAIDRALVEYPNGLELKVAARNLTAPSAVAFVNEEGPHKGSILIAESGAGGTRPQVYGFKPDGSFFSVYPYGRRIEALRFFGRGNEIYGPIGGMVVTQGKIFVTHCDARGRGAVSSLGFDGAITTVVADLPAQGDYGVTDITVHPTSGRLYFGIGSATNSGVVGIDNWQIGWVKDHPKFCDQSPVNLKLFGYRFDTKNPKAGLFGGDDIAVTAPYQPFGTSNQLRIRKAANDKPTSAVYSVSPSGGDLRVEAHGLRLPRGLAFNEYYSLFATNNGMELRGTRPIKDDPDALVKIIPGTWYGWPDFSADLVPIYDPRFQPPVENIIRTGYPESSFLIDHGASGLVSPASYRETLLFGVMPALSGAAKLDFVTASGGAFGAFRGCAIVALSGDRAPFATGGQKLRGFIGYKVVRIDLDGKRVEDFVYNTRGKPAQKLGRNVEALERPVDVKFGPDGKLYILDFGLMQVRDGREKITPCSGRLFVLEPAEQRSK